MSDRSLPTVLVTGFGSFPGVERNPTEHLVRAIDGAVVGGHRVHGRVLSVEYVRGPEDAITAARAVGARLVLGLGVAMGRARPTWERRGVRYRSGPADVSGATEPRFEGPEEVGSTLARDRGAALFDALPSEDAGNYVCNAWVYRVSHGLAVPVGFLHVPPEGIPSHRLLTGLACLVAELP